RFKLWEGEIDDKIHENRFIGTFKIRGSDFDGVIAAGAELVCSYEVLDSGNIILEVAVPSLGSSFHSGRNLYSRQEGQIDYTDASQRIEEELQQVQTRLGEIAAKVDDPRLDRAKETLERLTSLNMRQNDPEAAKEVMDSVQETKRLLAMARKEHRKDIRQLE